MKKREAFTLIELIAVLVILAILALIVTPLVMNIIKKARVSADKRSIDAYGRSIELAIADYLLDKGEFPTSIEQLTIEYIGDEVLCNTTTLNEDDGVYLADCTVGGRNVADYTYGKEQITTYKAYEIGDEVTYNNVNYYVIKNSGVNESSVTLLKAEPITSSEISPYLSSTEVATKVNTSGTYAEMTYYSAEDCASSGDLGCTSEYLSSSVKQIVDAWKFNYARIANEARLITYDEIITFFNFDYKEISCGGCGAKGWFPSEETPGWSYNRNYSYWTMSKKQNNSEVVMMVQYKDTGSGYITPVPVYYVGVVRPVIILSKSFLN